MSDLAIRIENLGKRYVLGETHEATLSEQLGRWIRSPFRPRASARADQSEFWALKDISLDVKQGEALGIVGGNGAGKSTLLKILSRITPPTTGRAQVRGRLSSLLEVGTGFHPELTGRENVFLNGTILGMRKNEVARKFDEIVAFSGVEKFIDTPVKRYSSGMYVRLAFAVAAHLEPDVLIIDEVLAVGDADFQRRCIEKMKSVTSDGRTVLFVSHSMQTIRRLCERVIWLSEGNVKYDGAAENAVQKYLSGGRNESREREGYLFKAQAPSNDPVCLSSVQILDKRGASKTMLKTWEDVVFRIRFQARQHFPNLSLVIRFVTAEGSTILLTSTRPDRNVGINAQIGEWEIDLAFPRFPLSAGKYDVALAFAIPYHSYINGSDYMFELDVHEFDVYGTGLCPHQIRYAVASDHEWAQPQLVHGPTP